MSKYKYLLIDLDDTLIDNQRSTFETIKKVYTEVYNKYCNYSTALDYLSKTNRFWKDVAKNRIVDSNKEFSMLSSSEYIIYRYMNTIFNCNLDNYLDVQKRFIEIQEEHIYPFDYVEEIIASLSKYYKIIISTNGIKELVDKKIELCNISKYIDEVIIAGKTTKNYKPSKEFYNEVMSIVGDFNKDDYIMIGDEYESDIYGAYTIGIDSIWFNSKNDKVKDTFNLTKTKIIYSLSNLLDLLEYAIK